MDGKVNLKVVIHKIISRWYYFALTLVLMVLAAYFYMELTPKRYLIRASLLLQPENRENVDTDKFLSGMSLVAYKTELEDEVGILRSYSLIEQTLRQLDFGVSYFEKKNMMCVEKYGDVPFTVELDSSVKQMVNIPVYIDRLSEDKYRVRVSGDDVGIYNLYTNRIENQLDDVSIRGEAETGSPFSVKHLSFKVKFANPYDPSENRSQYFVINDLKSVTEKYQKNIKIDPISKESNIVELNVKGSVPEKEIRFLDKLMDVYLHNELQKKNQLGMKTIQFIDNQLNDVSDSLQQVEGSLESFRSKSNIVDINATAENITHNLDELTRQRSEVEVKLNYYKYIASSLQNNKTENIVAPSSYGVDDPLLNNLLIELSKLNQERSALNYGAKEGSPVTAVTDLKIQNNRRAIIENVDNFIDASNIALNNIDARMSQLKGALRRLPESERQLVNIKRRFDFSDNVYNYLLQKRAEAGIAVASNTVEKSVVDRAKQVGSGPVFPDPRLIYFLAFFLAASGGLSLIILKDFMNDNIVNQEDVERYTSIPFVGVISHAGRRERANIVADTQTLVGESFRSLRVNLQYLTLGKDNNVIGITSSVEGEGKTFCAVNLAASIAMSRRKTVLIDADLRQPRIATYFKLEGKRGLSSYLIDQQGAPRDIIYATDVPGFDVIPSGPVPPNPVDLVGLPRMEELINELKKTYNTIIIDSSPIGYVSEYIILMKYTDANIYIVRSDYTNRSHLDKINKLYDNSQIKNVSILLNDVKTNGNGYSYKYKKS